MVFDISIKKVMIYVFVALLMGFAGGFLLGYFQQGTPVDCKAIPNLPASINGTCVKYSCDTITRDANYELLLKEKEVEGSGNLFGGNAKLIIPIKNTDSDGASFVVSMMCQTLKKSASTLISPKQYIGPNMTASFNMEYEIDANENWKCTNFTISAQAIKACELKALK